MKITTKHLSAQEMIDQKVKSYIYINMQMVGAVFLSIVVLLALHKSVNVLAQRVVCSSYRTQAEAQAHYTKALDRNGNGIACEGHHYKK